jgi:uncharacterized protein YkwD
MFVKSFFFPVIILLTISACTAPAPAAVAPQPTLTPIPATPTGTSVPTITPSPTLMPAAPSTSGTQPACEDSASLVADVTIPDNTREDPGQAFLKIWRIRNTGACTWNANYTLVYSAGSQMGSPLTTPFQTTGPGQTLDLSVDLVAPTADGTYTGDYELHDASGQTFLVDNYKTMWVKIVVGSIAAQPAATTAVAAAVVPTGTSATSGTCTYTDNPGLVSQLYTLINNARAENGLPALTVNPKLAASARAHSIDMACHSLLSHTGSDNSTIKSRIAAQGYKYDYWNEAIYAQPPQYGGDAQAAVEWWLNDPPHRVILLTDQGTEFGAGYADVASSTLGGYFTVDFGSPQH